MNESLPQGWKMVSLDDVAEDVNDRVDNPSESGYERFVGLDHLTSGDLTVKTWGSTKDVASSMKVFKEGDLLFARRNAYLKRASMATFEGVCSGDAFVLRQKPGILADNYLPLLFNTDKLWDYAISYAAGSMSKRVKWRDLSNFEIPLPPVNEQHRITKILWMVDDRICKTENSIKVGENYKIALMRHLFTYGPVGIAKANKIKMKETEIGKLPEDWHICSINEISNVRRGASPRPINDLKYFSDTGRGWVRISDVTNKYKYLRKTSQYLSAIGESKSVKVNPGDLIMSICATIGKPILVDMEACIHDGFVLFENVSDSVDKEYFFYYLLKNERKFVNKKQPGTQGNLNTKIVGKTKIPIPSIEVQKMIVNILRNIDAAIQKLYNNKKQVVSVKKSLINNLMYGKISLGRRKND